jgi:hypothetical protein
MSHRWAQRSPRWGETELERRVGGRHLEPFELRRGHRRRTSRKSVRWRHFYTCTSNKPRDVLALLLRCFVRFERYRHRCPACSARYFASFQLHASARQLSERAKSGTLFYSTQGAERLRSGTPNQCMPYITTTVLRNVPTAHCHANTKRNAGPSCRVNMYSSVRRGTLADARAS